MSKKKTAAEIRIAAAPASAFRKLTKIELEKLGFSPKSERYIEVGKRIAKNVKTISKRLFTIKKTGLSPETAAKAHSEGELLYKSRKTQEAAEKQKTTRKRQRLKKQLAEPVKDLTSKEIERAAANFGKKIANVREIRPGVNSTRPRTPYKPTWFNQNRLQDLYRRKLSGERLADGDWHQLADYVQTVNDPNIARIMQSKDDKRQIIDDLEEVA